MERADQRRGRRDNNCFNCGQPGHLARNCPAPRAAPAAAPHAVPPAVPDNLPGYVDTHCHLDYILQKLNTTSLAEIKRRCTPSFEACISIYCDPAAMSPSLGTYTDQLADPQVYGAFGIHPHSSKFYNDALEQRIVAALAHPKVRPARARGALPPPYHSAAPQAVAWGETGLDYHYKHSPPAEQREVFVRQIRMAVLLKKPLIVHSREAEKDTVELLRANMPADWPVHIHCFNDSAEYLQQLLATFPRAYIGITGVVTFEDARRLREIVARLLPLERLLLETDAPYMAPRPHKGPSHPGHIPAIAECIAQVKGVTVQAVMLAARQNTRALYGI